MTLKKECLFDGKVLVERLVNLASVEFVPTRASGEENVPAKARDKDKGSKQAKVRRSKRKISDQLLDIVEFAVTAANKTHDATSEDFETLSKRIPAEFLGIWNQFLDNLDELLIRLYIIQELHPRLEKLSALAQSMNLSSKESIALRNEYEAAAKRTKDYWFAGRGAAMPLVECRKFDLYTNIQDLEALPQEAADVFDFAWKASSPLVVQETRMYIKRLSTITFDKVTSGLLVGLQSFHFGIKAYAEMCPGSELTYIMPSAKPEPLIGRGHFGQVVLTEFDGKFTAKKQLSRGKIVKNGSRFSVFVQELWIWHKLTLEESPYIIKLLAAGVDPQTQDFVFVSEFASYRSLRFALKKQRLQQLGFVKSVSKDVAMALNHMHSCNLVHLDLKPSNVLLMREKGKVLAKLCDFGISQYVPTKSHPGAVNFLGSGLYMPPEARLWGYVAPSNDIFAFGLLLYELLEPCFDQLRHEDLPYLCSSRLRFQRNVLSTAVKQLIMDCTNYTRTERPTTAELLSRLSKLRLTKPLPVKLYNFMFQSQSCLTSQNAGSKQEVPNESKQLLPKSEVQEAKTVEKEEKVESPAVAPAEVQRGAAATSRIRKGTAGAHVSKSKFGSANVVDANRAGTTKNPYPKPQDDMQAKAKTLHKHAEETPGQAKVYGSQIVQPRNDDVPPTVPVPRAGVTWIVVSGATLVWRNMIVPCFCGRRGTPFANGMQPLTEADKRESAKPLAKSLEVSQNALP